MVLLNNDFLRLRPEKGVKKAGFANIIPQRDTYARKCSLYFFGAQRKPYSIATTTATKQSKVVLLLI